MSPRRRRNYFDRAAIGQTIAVFVVGLLLFGTLSYTAWLPGTAGSSVDASALGISVAVGAIFGVVGIGTLFRVWARSGGRPMVVRMDTALDAGEVPAEADPLAWVPALQTWRQSMLIARYIAPALAVLFVITAVPRLVSGTTVVAGVLAVIVAIAGAVAAVAIIARTQSRVPAIEPLLTDLIERQARTDERVAETPSEE